MNATEILRMQTAAHDEMAACDRILSQQEESGPVDPQLQKRAQALWARYLQLGRDYTNAESAEREADEARIRAHGGYWATQLKD